MQSVVRSLRIIGLVASLSSMARPASAQGVPAATAPQPPSISASAVGETRITPDRALLSVAVETQGESAAAAASANARLQARIIDAVKATGIPAAQVRTSGYNVYPEYSGGRTPKVTGYRARNTVQIEIRTIGSVGQVIDAALGAGATNIGALGLYASSTDSARRQAVAQAVTKARTEAEAAAAAAGGSLGPLAELTIEPYGIPRPYATAMVTATAALEGAGPIPPPTPVETGELVVQAVIRARWHFLSSR